MGQEESNGGDGWAHAGEETGSIAWNSSEKKKTEKASFEEIDKKSRKILGTW